MLVSFYILLLFINAMEKKWQKKSNDLHKLDYTWVTGIKDNCYEVLLFYLLLYSPFVSQVTLNEPVMFKGQLLCHMNGMCSCCATQCKEKKSGRSRACSIKPEMQSFLQNKSTFLKNAACAPIRTIWKWKNKHEVYDFIIFCSAALFPSYLFDFFWLLYPIRIRAGQLIANKIKS